MYTIAKTSGELMEPSGVPLVTGNDFVNFPFIRSLCVEPLIRDATARTIFHGACFFLRISIVIDRDRDGKAFLRSIKIANPGTCKILVTKNIKVLRVKIASIVPVPALKPNCRLPVALLVLDHDSRRDWISLS
jgi:hypothetical protein